MQGQSLNKMEISARIKSAMKESGLTNRELASLLGVSEVTISKYVNGVSTPKNAYLTKLATVLNVSILWILTGFNKKENSVQDIFCSEIDDCNNYKDEVNYWKKRAIEAENNLDALRGHIMTLSGIVEPLNGIVIKMHGIIGEN